MVARLTALQVSEQLNVSRRHVYRLAESRQLQGLKSGRIWRFTQKAVDAYDTANTRQPDDVVQARTAQALGVSTTTNLPAIDLDGPYELVVKGSVPWRTEVIQ